MKFVCNTDDICVPKPSATSNIVAQDRALRDKPVCMTRGIFTVRHPLTEAQSRIMDEVAAFYKESSPSLRKLASILQQKAPVSLRAFDWLVTNYEPAQNHVVCSEQFLTVSEIYKNKLTRYKRRSFDPFRRSQRVVDGHKVFYLIEFNCDDKKMTSTLGQLNFIKFVLETNLWDLAIKWKDDIDRDMLSRKKKRQKVTHAAKAERVRIFNTVQTVQF